MDFSALDRDPHVSSHSESPPPPEVEDDDALTAATIDEHEAAADEIAPIAPAAAAAAAATATRYGAASPNEPIELQPRTSTASGAAAGGGNGKARRGSDGGGGAGGGGSPSASMWGAPGPTAIADQTRYILDVWNELRNPPLSRVIISVERDLSDALLVSEFCGHMAPELTAQLALGTDSADRKVRRNNWKALNEKVFRVIGFELSAEQLDAAADAVAGAVQLITDRLQKELSVYLLQRIQDQQQQPSPPPATASAAGAATASRSTPPTVPAPNSNNVIHHTSSSSAVTDSPTAAVTTAVPASPPTVSSRVVVPASAVLFSPVALPLVAASLPAAASSPSQGLTAAEHESVSRALLTVEKQLQSQHAAILSSFEQEVTAYQLGVLRDEEQIRIDEYRRVSLQYQTSPAARATLTAAASPGGGGYGGSILPVSSTHVLSELENKHTNELMALSSLLVQEFDTQKKKLLSKLKEKRETKLKSVLHSLIDQTLRERIAFDPPQPQSSSLSLSSPAPTAAAAAGKANGRASAGVSTSGGKKGASPGSVTTTPVAAAPTSGGSRLSPNAVNRASLNAEASRVNSMSYAEPAEEAQKHVALMGQTLHVFRASVSELESKAAALRNQMNEFIAASNTPIPTAAVSARTPERAKHSARRTASPAGTRNGSGSRRPASAAMPPSARVASPPRSTRTANGASGSGSGGGGGGGGAVRSRSQPADERRQTSPRPAWPLPSDDERRVSSVSDQTHSYASIQPAALTRPPSAPSTQQQQLRRQSIEHLESATAPTAAAPATTSGGESKVSDDVPAGYIRPVRRRLSQQQSNATAAADRPMSVGRRQRLLNELSPAAYPKPAIRVANSAASAAAKKTKPAAATTAAAAAPSSAGAGAGAGRVRPKSAAPAPAVARAASVDSTSSSNLALAERATQRRLVELDRSSRELQELTNTIDRLSGIRQRLSDAHMKQVRHQNSERVRLQSMGGLGARNGATPTTIRMVASRGAGGAGTVPEDDPLADTTAHRNRSLHSLLDQYDKLVQSINDIQSKTFRSD